MGFFSWKTNDTNNSIPNRHQDTRDTFPVYLLDDKGNKWLETDYDGYGCFGGKDYYVLMAEMNGFEGTEVELRTLAIHLEFYPRSKWSREMQEHMMARDLLFPQLVQGEYEFWFNKKPENCPDQGFFYSNNDRNDDYYWE